MGKDVSVTLTENQITLQQGDNEIVMTEEVQRDIYKDVETNFYYRQDVIGYFNDENNKGYDTDAVLNDKDLVDNIVYDYAELRFKNNGGNPDTMMSWEECLDEAISNYEIELEKYRTEQKPMQTVYNRKTGEKWLLLLLLFYCRKKGATNIKSCLTTEIYGRKWKNNFVWFSKKQRIHKIIHSQYKCL